MNEPNTTTEPGAVAAPAADAPVEQNPLLVPAAAPAAGTEGVETGGEASGASGAAEGTEGKPAGGFFGKLLGKLDGRLPACTCGKPADQGGQHKATCARRVAMERNRGKGGTGHFAAPVLPAANDRPKETAAVVSPQQPPAPRNHSFYGDCLETYLAFRSRAKSRKMFKRCEPVVGEGTARKLSDEYLLPKEELKKLNDEMQQCARESNWPGVHPFASIGVKILKIEAEWKFADWRVEDTLKEILAEQKKQTAALEELNGAHRA